eukprot:781706-Pelagomonas_calceolata.AAC.1
MACHGGHCCMKCVCRAREQARPPPILLLYHSWSGVKAEAAGGEMHRSKGTAAARHAGSKLMLAASYKDLGKSLSTVLRGPGGKSKRGKHSTLYGLANRLQEFMMEFDLQFGNSAARLAVPTEQKSP